MHHLLVILFPHAYLVVVLTFLLRTMRMWRTSSMGGVRSSGFRNLRLPKLHTSPFSKTKSAGVAKFGYVIWQSPGLKLLQ